MKFDFNIILASNSPRRKELLDRLDIDYRVNIIPNIDESYPADLELEKVAEYLSKKKAQAYIETLEDKDLLITADTVVLLENKIYGKPKDEQDAIQMLENLSGKTHKVTTGLCLTSVLKQVSITVESEVQFSALDRSEIEYYVSKYKPFDKAGAYGIQEWIGSVAVESISGSYFNIMGLPVQRLYQELKKF